MLLSDVCLSDVWRLSVAYIGPNSRTDRPRKTKIGTWIVHVTHNSDTLSRSKGQRSRSPDRFSHRGLNASDSCSGERGNVLGVGNYCYVAVCSALGASVPTGGGKGRGYIVAAARLQLVYDCSRVSAQCPFHPRLEARPYELFWVCRMQFWKFIADVWSLHFPYCFILQNCFCWRYCWIANKKSS